MCRSKTSTDVIEPKKSSSRPRISTTTTTTRSSRPATRQSSESEAYRSSQRTSCDPSTSNNLTSGTYTTTISSDKGSWQSSISGRTSLSNLRESLPENAHIYEFSEICSATNNFLAKNFSSSSSSLSWRCVIGGDDVVVFQRKFRRQIALKDLRQRLSLIHKSHHTSLIKLRGASVSENYIYLVYDYVHGANLSNCLRNSGNPNFTVLSNWLSRIQIATDVAHGLDYIHHSTGLSSGFIHNHIKSSSIIVIEPSLNAKICHFGTAELCGEIANGGEQAEKSKISGFKRSDGHAMIFSGARGYMSPEFQSNGIATKKSDVFAFGVVILELLSGKEPFKYKFNNVTGGYQRISVIETAREAVEGGGEGGGGGLLRRWMDERLKDSYPVEVAEKMARVGLECVEVDPDRRPDMERVASRISKLYLESKLWAEKMGVPTDFTVSLAPR